MQAKGKSVPSDELKSQDLYLPWVTGASYLISQLSFPHQSHGDKQ